jgi:hypothetical protein
MGLFKSDRRPEEPGDENYVCQNILNGWLVGWLVGLFLLLPLGA